MRNFDDSYSPSNAKLILSEFNQIMGRILEIAKILKSNEAGIADCTNMLASKGAAEGQIRRYLEQNTDIPGNDMRQLLKLLYIHKSIVPQVKQLYEDTESDRRKAVRCIEELKAAGSGLKRLFMSKEKKQAAENAYHTMNGLLEAGFGSRVGETFEFVRRAHDADENGILQDFWENTNVYWHELNMVVKSPEKLSGEILCIKDCLTRWDRVISLRKNAEEQLKKQKEIIRQTVDVVLQENAIADLRNIPVDELNRGKKGIRVKTLSDAGFTTMADVYSASISRLSHINGISEDASRQCKEIADRFFAQAVRAGHIKLNADNRTRETNAIVCAAYNYKLIQEIEEAEQIIINNSAPGAEKSYKALKKTGNAIIWIFSDEQRKKGIRNHFSLLNSRDSAEITGKLRELDAFFERLRPTSEKAWQSFLADPILYYNILESIIPGILGDRSEVYGLPEDLAHEIQNEKIYTEGLLCTLRPYQELGVKYTIHQKNVIIGDEMGLGKTVQAIASMVSLHNTGASHFLVVCPASVMENWYREIKKHSVLQAMTIHGQERTAEFDYWLNNGGAAVTTFETIAKLNMPEGFIYSLLIVDEAHYIKNPEANRTRNLIRIAQNAERRMFMTGTVLENRVDEMISLIGILNKNLASDISGVAYVQTAEQFRNDIVSVYYRRRREDVLKELPELIEKREWCTMSDEERTVYNSKVISRNYADIRRVSWNVSDISRSCKASRMKEIIEEAREDERKIIVFSFFLNTLEIVKSILGDVCYGPINGSVKPEKRQEIIDEFNEAAPGSVLAAQIQSGGTGLNIQSASVVILCEPQLKPSIENQAIARAYRMGQARNVIVHRLLCTDTTDERIIEMLEEKQKLFNVFADKSAADQAICEIDDTSFGKIVDEEIEKITGEKNENVIK